MVLTLKESYCDTGQHMVLLTEDIGQHMVLLTEDTHLETLLLSWGRRSNPRKCLGRVEMIFWL